LFNLRIGNYNWPENTELHRWRRQRNWNKY